MKRYSSVIAGTLLGLAILAWSLCFIIENQIKSKINNYSYGGYQLMAEKVSLKAINKLKINDIIIYRKQDTIATIKEFVTDFDISLLFDGKLKLNNPIFRNVFIFWKDSATPPFESYKPASSASLNTPPPQKKSTTQHPNIQPQLSQTHHPDYPQKPALKIEHNFGDTTNIKKNVIRSFESLPFVRKLMLENLQQPPEIITILDAKLKYLSASFALELKTEKIEIFPY